MVPEWPFLDFNEWITPTLLADPWLLSIAVLTLVPLCFLDPDHLSSIWPTTLWQSHPCHINRLPGLSSSNSHPASVTFSKSPLQREERWLLSPWLTLSAAPRQVLASPLKHKEHRLGFNSTAHLPRICADARGIQQGNFRIYRFPLSDLTCTLCSSTLTQFLLWDAFMVRQINNKWQQVRIKSKCPPTAGQKTSINADQPTSADPKGVMSLTGTWQLWLFQSLILKVFMESANP